VDYKTENVAQMPKVQVNKYLWTSSQSLGFMGWSRRGGRVSYYDGYDISCIRVINMYIFTAYQSTVQIRIVLSQEVERICLLSGENEIEHTVSVCSDKVAASCPVFEFQT
jgi:hypothetical protein